MSVLENYRCPVHDCDLEECEEVDDEGVWVYYRCTAAGHTYPAKSNGAGGFYPFDPVRWLAWLKALARHRERCLFAVVPDVVGDAVGTLARGTPYLRSIRDLGYTPAYVSQDDADRHPIPWDQFGCLFVGGTDAWKLSERSWALCAEAKRRGKWVHVGRVNSFRRLRACRVSLVDSADGTQLAFRPSQTLPLLLRWLDALKAQSVMVA